MLIKTSTTENSFIGSNVSVASSREWMSRVTNVPLQLFERCLFRVGVIMFVYGVALFGAL